MRRILAKFASNKQLRARYCAGVISSANACEYVVELPDPLSQISPRHIFFTTQMIFEQRPEIKNVRWDGGLIYSEQRPVVVNLEDLALVIFNQNLGGGITTVAIYENELFSITGFKQMGNPFKQFHGSAKNIHDIGGLPWIDLPQLKIIYDCSTESTQSRILSCLDFGSTYISRSESYGPIDGMTESSQTGPLKITSTPIRAAGKLEKFSRKSFFGAMIKAIFSHGELICTELGVSECSELFQARNFNLTCTSASQYLEFCKEARMLWREASMQEHNGSLDPFLFSALISIRYWTHTSVARVEADQFLDQCRGFIFSGIDSLEREDAAAFLALAISAHLRYFSDHTKERFSRPECQIGRMTGYVDHAALAMVIPEVVSAIIQQSKQQVLSRQDGAQISRLQFLLYALSSSIDPILFFDRQDELCCILNSVKNLFPPDQLRGVFQTMLAEKWDFSGTPPWLSCNIAFETIHSPINQLLESDRPIAPFYFRRDYHHEDPRLLFMRHSSYSPYVFPYCVYHPDIPCTRPSDEQRRSIFLEHLRKVSDGI